MTAAAADNTDIAEETGRAIIPPGYMPMFILSAMTKRVLQSAGIKGGEQLALLEKLNGLTDRFFTAEILAMISPASDIECEMIAAAREADPPKTKRCEASFNIFMSERVFALFASANPGIREAVRIFGHHRKGTE